MNRGVQFFAAAVFAAVLVLMTWAHFRFRGDLEVYRQEWTGTFARATAWVEQQSRQREDAGAAQATQNFLQAVKKATPAVQWAMVLKNAKIIAHTDPARADGRLDSDSLGEKALFDAAAALKADVGKNIEERAKDPKRTLDAFPELSLKPTQTGYLALAPVKQDDTFLAATFLEAAPPSPGLAFPYPVLLIAAAAFLLFFAAARRRSDRAQEVLGGVLLLVLVAGAAFFLLEGLQTQRKDAAAQVGQTLAVLGPQLVNSAAPGQLDTLAKNLSMGPDGGDRGQWVAVKSSTVGAAPQDTIVFSQGGYEAHLSLSYLASARSADAGTIFGVGLVAWLLGLLVLVLGVRGYLFRGFKALQDHRQAYQYLSPAMAGLIVLVFIPVVYGLLLGFQRREYNQWSFVGLDNYIQILSDTNFGDVSNFYYKLGVTILWTVTNVVLHVSIGLFLALLLNDQLLKAKGIFRVLLIVPWAVPNYITALIWKGMFHREFGAVNFFLEAMGMEPVAWFQSFWPAFFTNLATNTWLGFPFMMVISLGALQSIPSDLYEAAWVDGASRWQRFRNITLPLLMPALVPSVIVGSVWTFNMFNIIYLVSGGAPNGATDILITEAYRWAFERNNYGYAAAYSTLIFVILLLFTISTNKITGATKGAYE